MNHRYPLLSKTCLTTILLMFFSCVLLSPVQAEDSSEHVIQYRQYLMKSISSHYKALKYLTSGKITQPAQWLPQSRALNDTAKMVVDAFPEDSDFGETDAKEDIWENKDDFNQKAQDLVAASHSLMKLIQESNVAGAKKQLEELGKSCKSCHKKYREM